MDSFSTLLTSILTIVSSGTGLTSNNTNTSSGTSLPVATIDLPVDEEKKGGGANTVCTVA
ncbi:hypothetical protein D9611_011727 [Ephemerocybe angulata]|uniref:Uncharacterized protein n=1 Tax=Ephemerocybe angulata TaxID=980116 RepID=A0A8H5C5L3_9AGAR|nr:hypothetical protein D9611_011727 [Tulosesus angulatus]